MKKHDSLQTDTTQRLLKIIKERTKVCTQYELLQKKMLVTDHLTWRRGLWFFVSFRIFFSDNTRVRIFLFWSRKARIFFQESNIRLYDKNSESDYIFFPPPKSEYFFQQHWESEYFFRKITKLNGRSLTMFEIDVLYILIIF
jgi:hypothetical protein